MSIADKLAVIAENEQRVYDAGYAAGQNAGGGGYDEGFAAGKQDERTHFWDTFQNSGLPVNEKGEGGTNVYYAFAYDRFDDSTFNPIYPIYCTQGTNSGSRAFYNAKKITDINVAIYANSNNADFFFFECNALVTIPLFSVLETTKFNSTFNGCKALVNLTMGGTIGQPIDLSASPLSRASIESVVTHLSDSASSMTATFSKSAVLSAFGTEAAWTEYIAKKPNWTFTLK